MNQVCTVCKQDNSEPDIELRILVICENCLNSQNLLPYLDIILQRYR